MTHSSPAGTPIVHQQPQPQPLARDFDTLRQFVAEPAYQLLAHDLGDRAVCAIIKHANPTRDFSNVALRIRSLKPDLVIMSNYQNEYVLLARTLHQQKVDLAAMFSVLGGGFNYKLVQEQPDVAQHMIDFNHWFNPRSPRAAEVSKRAADRKALFTFEVYCGYNSVKLYADALERAGTADREKAIAALESSTWSDHFMPYGPTKFVNGQNEGGRAVLLQATRTDIEVVWPDQFAAAKPVFPRPKSS